MNMLVGMTLLLGVLLGNTVIQVFLMNYLYACPFPKRALSPVRPIVAVTLSVGTFAFACLYWEYAGDWGALLAGSTFPVSAYVVVCWVVGFVVFPLATLNNHRIRRSAVL